MHHILDEEIKINELPLLMDQLDETLLSVISPVMSEIESTITV